MAKRINRCMDCNKLIVEEVLCEACKLKRLTNQDPLDVAPMNLLKLFQEAKKLTDAVELANALEELEMASNHAYYYGYISEDFYQIVADKVGFTPEWNKRIYISKDFEEWLETNLDEERMQLYEMLMKDEEDDSHNNGYSVVNVYSMRYGG